MTTLRWDPLCRCGHLGTRHVDQELDCLDCGPEGCNGFDQSMADWRAQQEVAEKLIVDASEPWALRWRPFWRAAGYSATLLACAVLVGTLAYHQIWWGVVVGGLAALIVALLAEDEL